MLLLLFCFFFARYLISCSVETRKIKRRIKQNAKHEAKEQQEIKRSTTKESESVYGHVFRFSFVCPFEYYYYYCVLLKIVAPVGRVVHFLVRVEHNEYDRK